MRAERGAAFKAADCAARGAAWGRTGAGGRTSARAGRGSRPPARLSAATALRLIAAKGSSKRELAPGAGDASSAPEWPGRRRSGESPAARTRTAARDAAGRRGSDGREDSAGRRPALRRLQPARAGDAAGAPLGAMAPKLAHKCGCNGLGARERFALFVQPRFAFGTPSRAPGALLGGKTGAAGSEGLNTRLRVVLHASARGRARTQPRRAAAPACRAALRRRAAVATSPQTGGSG